MNDTGKVAFAATVSSTGNLIVVADPQGALSIVAKAGDAAAGTTGAEFQSVGGRLTIVNEVGQVLFDGLLEDGVGVRSHHPTATVRAGASVRVRVVPAQIVRRLLTPHARAAGA